MVMAGTASCGGDEVAFVTLGGDGESAIVGERDTATTEVSTNSSANGGPAMTE